MRIRTQYLTRHACCAAGRSLAPAGVMLHSTGANNPNVSRYVPGDGVIGYNTGGTHWDQTNEEWKAKFGKPLDKCVHAFVGRFADGSVGAVQTLPWTMRAWHCGNATGNSRYIGFEICEDGLDDPAYFAAVYRAAVELTAFLCRQFGLDPLADGVVICHAEGYRRGVASNHGDVLHWFGRHGKTMDDLRADVAREMEEQMTEERVREIIRDELQKIESHRADLAASPWAQELLEQAKRKGITDGSRPQSYATRQEVALMVNAAVK